MTEISPFGMTLMEVESIMLEVGSMRKTDTIRFYSCAV